ncbi:MAG: hypothetical protein EA411_13230 [Saprospirales bacterium]|nr:MAG: hypothetical protein EA411_13230 [Saprospirales bacterium]
MSRITTLALLLTFLFSGSAHGQLEKGSLLLDFRGHSGYDSEIDHVIPRLYAKVGYFPTQALAVGVRVGGYGHLVSGQNFGDAMYAGFARYYFNPNSDNYFFYGELEGGIISNYSEFADTRNLTILKPTVGANFINTGSVAIEAALGISIIENPNTEELRFNNFVMKIGWRSMINESSKEMMKEMREEAEPFFRRGTVSLSSGFNLNSDFVPGRFIDITLADVEFNSEAVSYNNLSDGRSAVLAFNAGVGFFLSEQTMFSLNMGVTNFGGSEFEGATTLFSIEPGLRYYLSLGEQSRSNLYLQGGYEFGGLNLEGLGTEYTYGFLNGGIGINYMLTPGSALELGVDYGQLKTDETSGPSETINLFKFNYGLRVFL